MRLNLLPLLLAPLTLAACDSPRLMTGYAYVGGVPAPWPVVLEGNYDSILFQTEPAAAAIRAQVSKVQFIIGTKTVTASAEVGLRHVYVWASLNPCEELPQGDKLPLKYEMLDANNAVVQQASTTVDIQTCR